MFRAPNYGQSAASQDGRVAMHPPGASVSICPSATAAAPRSVAPQPARHKPALQKASKTSSISSSNLSEAVQRQLVRTKQSYSSVEKRRLKRIQNEFLNRGLQGEARRPRRIRPPRMLPTNTSQCATRCPVFLVESNGGQSEVVFGRGQTAPKAKLKPLGVKRT